MIRDVKANVARQEYQKRQHNDRLQRRKDGGFQLPSARRGPLVPTDAELTNYTDFNQNIGFRVHKNKKNRFCCVWWHYTEDPEKRDPLFEEEGRAANPVGWDQEMEIDFRSKKGVRVFSEFSWRRGDCDMGPYWSSESNVIMPTLAPPDWWPLYLTTDPGRRACWATCFVLIDQYGCWHVTKSLVRPGLHYLEAKALIAHLLGRRKPVDHVIDPASEQKRTDSLKTLIEKMGDPPHRMDCIPVDHRANEYLEIEELRERMKRRADGRFGVYFWDTVPNQRMIEQFRNCVYKDDKGEKILSEDVDSVDGLKYLATHLTGRAIAPKKPPEEMNDREYRAFLALTHRRKLYKNMGKKRPLGTNESYYGDPI